MRGSHREETSESGLNRAVHALRSHESGRRDVLAPGARQAIIEASYASLSRGGAQRMPRPAWLRLAVAAVVPVVVFGTALWVQGLRVSPPDEPKLTVAKQGNEVVFKVTDGGEVHTLYRSTVPNRFERRSAVRLTDGSFVDQASDGNGIVFYRVD